MKNVRIIFSLVIVSIWGLVGCNDDDVTPPQTGILTLDISGLEDLGSNYAYEGWIIVNGSAISAGIFNVDANGNLSQNSFELDREDLANASTYVLTIEPSPDNDPGPSDVHILAGNFSGKSASVTIEHSAAIGTDFTNSTGEFILATPTDGGSDTDELSGVWWLNPANGPGPGLNLPTLPNGWKYEGWAVVNGTPVSTGTFTSVTGADEFSGFSGTASGAPPFPGEDLLMNAPSGLIFPTDLSGGTIVISVEPSPDNSPAPFLLKPLVRMLPSDALDHTLYQMSNNAISTNPSGTVKR
ncbi:anti-sigma factor [Algoriphagus limi]|uniref:Anti-sigma factor n=1 Tax=Algoriphagus limi TaxID=2975273 RepID=A0ABT2G833_9BACT|nr:anti-sigma factor [Algoriphagus limi]MCS5490898.1 anti-sigma factor [Algoriphagus limi]